MLAVITLDSPLCRESVNDVPIIVRVVQQLSALSILRQIFVVTDDPDMPCLDGYRVTLTHPDHVMACIGETEGDVLVCPCDLPFLDASALRSFLQHSKPFGKMITYQGETGVFVIPASLYRNGDWRHYLDCKTFVVDDMIGINVHGCETKLHEIQQIFDQPFVSFHDQSMIKKSHVVHFLSHKMSLETAKELFRHVHTHFPMRTMIFQWHPWTGILVLAVFTFEFHSSYKIGRIDCIVEHPSLRHEDLWSEMAEHLVWLGKQAGCRRVRFR